MIDSASLTDVNFSNTLLERDNRAKQSLLRTRICSRTRGRHRNVQWAAETRVVFFMRCASDARISTIARSSVFSGQGKALGLRVRRDHGVGDQPRRGRPTTTGKVYRLARAGFNHTVDVGGLLEADNTIISQAFVALNTTGLTIHMEPTFTMVYHFETSVA